MKRIVAVLLLMSAGVVATAQARPVSGGFGGFGPTMAFYDFAGLNAVLGKDPLRAELSSPVVAMGGGGYGFVREIIIGGSGWGTSQTVNSQTLRCRVDIGGGQFEVGYNAISTPHLIISPALGIGGIDYTITLEPNDDDVPELESLIAHPGRTSSVSTSRLLFTPELFITVPISFVGIQLRGGYMYSPVSSDWELGDGNHMNKGPELAKGTPFVNLNIVFGGVGGSRRSRSRS